MFVLQSIGRVGGQPGQYIIRDKDKLLRAALAFKKLGADLERAAAQLSE